VTEPIDREGSLAAEVLADQQPSPLVNVVERRRATAGANHLNRCLPNDSLMRSVGVEPNGPLQKFRLEVPKTADQQPGRRDLLLHRPPESFDDPQASGGLDRAIAMLDASASEVLRHPTCSELSPMVGHQMSRPATRVHGRLPKQLADPLGDGFPWMHGDRQDRSAEGVDHGANVHGDEAKEAFHNGEVHEPNVVGPAWADSFPDATQHRGWSRTWSAWSPLLEEALHARPRDLESQSSQHVGDSSCTPFGLIEAEEGGKFVDQIRKATNKPTRCHEALPRLLERLQPTKQRPLAHDEGLGRSSKRQPIPLPVPEDSESFPGPVSRTSTSRKAAEAPPEEVVLGLKSTNVLLQRKEQTFAGSAGLEDDALNSGEDACQRRSRTAGFRRSGSPGWVWFSGIELGDLVLLSGPRSG